MEKEEDGERKLERAWVTETVEGGGVRREKFLPFYCYGKRRFRIYALLLSTYLPCDLG